LSVRCERFFRSALAQSRWSCHHPNRGAVVPRSVTAPRSRSATVPRPSPRGALTWATRGLSAKSRITKHRRSVLFGWDHPDLHSAGQGGFRFNPVGGTGLNRAIEPDEASQSRPVAAFCDREPITRTTAVCTRLTWASFSVASLIRRVVVETHPGSTRCFQGGVGAARGV
jgi:hypothetical protein